LRQAASLVSLLPMAATLDTTFFARLPKIALHDHLLGTIGEATFQDLARLRGAAITAAEIAGFYLRGDKPAGVLRALRTLEREVLRQPADFHRITLEYLAGHAAQGVRHAEIFWNPTGSCAGADDYACLLSGIAAGMEDARRDHGITALLLPSIDREAPPEAAIAMVEWMIARPHPSAIGIGIDYNEVKGPPELFIPAYQLAARPGLRRTAHAGEFGCPAANIRVALRDLGVERLDHAYTALDDAALCREIADRNIIVTVVPTNSYYLRTLPAGRWAADHPIRRMPAAGLRIHPNTDDPPMHHIDPAGCWARMHDTFGFDANDIRQFMLNGIQGAFVDDATKAAWHAAFTAEFDALLQEPNP